MRSTLFSLLRTLLVAITGRGYDRGTAVNTVHHKLSYRLHKLLPAFGISGIRKLPVPGLPGKHMYVRSEDGGVAHQLIMYRQYEPFETSLVRRYLKPDDIVYNIGANLGYYVIVASDLLRSGRVYAFEPAPENLELLRRTVAENKLANVTVIDQAVGDRPGEAALSLSTTNSGDHQLTEVRGREHVTVRVTSVDALLRDGLEPPTAMILDVQGSELDVVRGMERLLSTPTLRVLFTEFWPQGLNVRAENGARAFLDTLIAAGFQLHVIDEKHRAVTSVTAEDLLLSTRGHEERNLLCLRGGV